MLRAGGGKACSGPGPSDQRLLELCVCDIWGAPDNNTSMFVIRIIVYLLNSNTFISEKGDI